jgi:hypothetical protein
VKFYGGTNASLADLAGHQITAHADILNPVTFPNSTTNIYTLFVQNP